MHILERFIYEVISYQELEARYPDEALIVKKLKKLEKLIKSYDASMNVTYDRRPYWVDMDALYLRVNNKIKYIFVSNSAEQMFYIIRYKFITQEILEKVNPKSTQEIKRLKTFIDAIDNANTLEEYESNLYYKNYKHHETSPEQLQAMKEFADKFGYKLEARNKNIRTGKQFIDYRIKNDDINSFVITPYNSKIRFAKQQSMWEEQIEILKILDTDTFNDLVNIAENISEFIEMVKASL